MIGTLLGGLSTYVFFKVGQVALGQDGFKPIVAMWFISFTFIPGLFVPLEQETSRALAHRTGLGQGSLEIVQRLIPLSASILFVLLVALAIGASRTADEFFDGNLTVAVAMGFMTITYSMLHLARGVLAGTSRFTSLALLIGIDGVMRVLICVGLWLVGVTSPGTFAIGISLSPILGLIVIGARGGFNLSSGPQASWSELTQNFGWLLVGSIAAAALVNAGPITVDILGDSSPAELVTRFGNAVIFSRVPLFLFGAVQAALLPKLARLVGQGDMKEFANGLKRLVYLVIGIGAIGTVGAFAIGPWVLELVYEGGIDRRTMSLLAGASAIYMLALALAQAVIALHGHAAVAFGWIAGFATFGIVAWLSSDDLYLRVELALLASSLASLVIFAVVARRQLRSGLSVNVESMIEAISERPLD